MNPCATQVDIYTASGAPAVSTPVLRSLAGKPGAAKKALLELEGQGASDSPTDDFEGDNSAPVAGYGKRCCVLHHLSLALAWILMHMCEDRCSGAMHCYYSPVTLHHWHRLYLTAPCLVGVSEVSTQAVYSPSRM